MRALLAPVLAILLLVALAGCGGVLSDHPLSDEKSSLPEDGLIGRWRALPQEEGEEPPPDLLYVGRAPGHERMLEAAWVEIDSEDHVKVRKLHLLATKVGAHAYLSVRGEGDAAQEGWLIVRYEMLDETRVRVVNLSQAVVAKAIESGALEGTVRVEAEDEDLGVSIEDVRVSSPPATFRAWLEANADTCTDPEESATFRKVVRQGP